MNACTRDSQLIASKLFGLFANDKILLNYSESFQIPSTQHQLNLCISLIRSSLESSFSIHFHDHDHHDKMAPVGDPFSGGVTSSEWLDVFVLCSAVVDSARSLLATSLSACFLRFSDNNRRMKTSSTIFSSSPISPRTDKPSKNPSEPPRSETN